MGGGGVEGKGGRVSVVHEVVVVRGVNFKIYDVSKFPSVRTQFTRGGIKEGTRGLRKKATDDVYNKTITTDILYTLKIIKKKKKLDTFCSCFYFDAIVKIVDNPRWISKSLNPPIILQV